MNGIIYKVTCLTNLHVGNGESNFNIIDNTVEKDPVTGLPTINSSGVKGALRQFFKEKRVNEDTITDIFGSDPKKSSENKGTGSKPGKVKFYQADLLARPVRATKGSKTNYMVVSKEAIYAYNLKAKIFGTTSVPLANLSPNTASHDNIGVDGISNLARKDMPRELKALIPCEIIISTDEYLRDIPLPVLARNQLEDGISKNLWYEEVVPHKSIFTFAVSADNKTDLERFSQVLEETPYVQFGGNASIGYGLCLVEKMPTLEKGDK